MKTIVTMLMLFVGNLQSHAEDAYAVLEVKINTVKASDKEVKDVAYYSWQTDDRIDSGELAEIRTKLKITTEVNGKFTEFHLVSGILKSGWKLCGVSATPQHQTNVPSVHREGTRVYHFTKSDSENTRK
jgi:hypothetical protein